MKSGGGAELGRQWKRADSAVHRRETKMVEEEERERQNGSLRSLAH